MINKSSTVEEKRCYLYTEMVSTYPLIANENRIALLKVINTFIEEEVDELLDSFLEIGVEETMKRAYDDFLQNPENFSFS